MGNYLLHLFLYFRPPKCSVFHGCTSWLQDLFLSRMLRKHRRHCYDTFPFNILSQKFSSTLSSGTCSWIRSLSNYQCLRLCGVGVRKELLPVSDRPALKTFRPRLPSFFLVPWVIAMMTHAAEKHLEQRNACLSRMEHTGVQKLEKFRSRVCTLINNHSPQLLQNIFALV